MAKSFGGRRIIKTPPEPAREGERPRGRGDPALAHKRVGPGGIEETPEEREYRIAAKPQLREAKKTNTDVQCQWCGLVVQGPRKGPHTRMLGGNVTSYTCPGCAVERDAANARDRMRRRMAREGIPESEWPPEILSRLERQTGIRYPIEPYEEDSPEPPILYDLKPLEEL